MPTDGFVVLDTQMRYVKYKHVKTVEVEFDSELNMFKNLDGPLSRPTTVVSPSIQTPFSIRSMQISKMVILFSVCIKLRITMET